jgi:hypothetical protein
LPKIPEYIIEERKKEKRRRSRKGKTKKTSWS